MYFLDVLFNYHNIFNLLFNNYHLIYFNTWNRTIYIYFLFFSVAFYWKMVVETTNGKIFELMTICLHYLFFYIFFVSQARYVPWCPGVIFGGFCLMCNVFITLLPETAHRQLPQITEDVEEWRRKSQEKKNSKKTRSTKISNKNVQEETIQEL